MIYTQVTMSPATVEFARSLGATGLHIGILGALPMGMLFAQFLAAVVVNHLTYRRWVWFWVSVAQRLSLVPLAVGPLLFPEFSDAVWIWLLIAFTAANHGLLHFATPLWLSWMGDYLPRDGLNRFWGLRQFWMQWAGAGGLYLAAMFLHRSGLPIRPAFAILILFAALLGIADLLLFLRVEEPPVAAVPQPRLARVLAAPFCDPDFRSFIVYSCFFHFAAMIGAPFISQFLLQQLGMDLYRVMLLWTWSWIGGAVLAGRLGCWAERFGHRPLLVLCTGLKSLIMLALLVVPANSTVAFWVLVLVFMVDAVLNSGMTIATNGFLLKNSPQQNRTMYIAAGTAVAGIVGGITSIAAGSFLLLLGDRALSTGGISAGGFHVVFLLSLVLRLASVGLACRIREASAKDTIHVVSQLIGVTPMRILRFPVGLYRSYGPLGGEEPATMAEERGPPPRKMAA